MPEFQLTHVALVGARISAFNAYGFHARNELAMRRVTPNMAGLSLLDLPERPLAELFRAQLPLWVHNILADVDFPQRETLLMPLRRFEGEMRDNRADEVVSAVLSAGFRDQTLNPMDLPDDLPAQQRCVMVMRVGRWQEAYSRLEHDLSSLLTACAPEIENWLDSTQEPSHAIAN
jgi:hypothetical protein